MSNKSRPALLRTFAAPAAIAAITAVGLIAALLGDGGFDATAWIALSVPVAVIAWAILKRSA